jgi:glycosyltransferase involved in cell wall biosynthesis
MTLRGLRKSLLKDNEDRKMIFSIITPSFRNSKWLKLCIASVADQEGIEFEHIVQDSCSDDGTLDWLPKDKRVHGIIEKDNGMYDAVNRGLHRSSGDILAYLNCDEQYLPGALKYIHEFFNNHPDVEVVLAGTVVVDTEGGYMCHRPSLVPSKYGIWFRFMALTSSIFFRRNVISSKELYFDTKWRVLGDIHWFNRLLQNDIKMKVANFYTSVFLDSGENLSFMPNAIEEKKITSEMIPSWVKKTKLLWIIQHRLRRLIAGHFIMKPSSYSAYTLNCPDRRTIFTVGKPTSIWWNRL